MPEPAARQGGKAICRPRIPPPWGVGARLILALLTLIAACWPEPLHAQRAGGARTNEHPFDIGIVIDNRPLPGSATARAEVDALIRLLDRQMYIEHVMVFERPTIEVICDLFGCPQEIEPPSPFPPLLWRITREGEARLFVYYIGDGRAEGLERQLLFAREAGRDDVAAFPVTWLHAKLEETGPASAVVMLDASFSPRPLPCASEDPHLIDEALLTARRDYRRIARDHWNRADVLELSATTPVQPAHCDRFGQMLEGVEEPLFTKLLLKGIVEGLADREPFGDEDRLIDLGELADYVDDHIERAARFQWGRRQNIRAVGSRSQVLASVDRRALDARNRALLDRRNRPAEPIEPIERPPDAPDMSPPAVGEAPAAEVPPTVRALGPTARCREDPAAEDCHPCVIDPGGRACAERCQQETGSDLCARELAAGTTAEPGDGPPGRPAGSISVVPREEIAAGESGGEDGGGRSAICRWVVEHVSPYTSALVQRIRGDTAPTCDWAGDRSKVELGPIAQIFTPIAWRLGRSNVQDTVACLLDCNPQSPSAPITPQVELAAAGEPAAPAARSPAPPAPVDPRGLDPLQRQVCDRLDEPVPPHIGLPRWMPGTLIVSEALRGVYGCPAPPPEPELPVPIAVAIAPPAIDPAPVLLATDERLAEWPPHAVDVGTPQIAGQAPMPAAPAESAAQTITETAAETIDHASVAGDVSADDPPPQAEMPFAATIGKVRWLQSALTVDNRNPGPIDGAMGPKTMQAVRSWRRDNDREDRTGELTEPEFQAIIEQFGDRFEQIRPRARSF